MSALTEALNAQNDYLLKDFNEEERAFIIASVYPKLKLNLEELLLKKENNQGEFVVDVKLRSLKP